MRTATQNRAFVRLLAYVTLCFVGGMEMPLAETPQDHQDKIATFGLASGIPVARSAVADPVRPEGVVPFSPGRRSVGSALSPQAGIGVGESIALTWDDAQYTQGQGRHIGHWWNGEYGDGAEVSVHFGYSQLTDSATGSRYYYSGYNVFDAAISLGGWPVGQNVGCDLQSTDTLGSGGIPSLDIMPNGRVVMGATGAFWRSRTDASRLVDNMVFYQGDEFSCAYDPRVNLNVTWIDSTSYRPQFLVQTEGTYSFTPQVTSQWDGTNTIVHLLVGEDSDGVQLSGNDYSTALQYRAFVYYRKVGANAGEGSWSAGQIIDSMWFPWVSLAAAPHPYEGVAVTYTNPSFYGTLLNHEYDMDVWLRESLDRGLTWQNSECITYYMCDPGPCQPDYTHWLESQALYSTDGELHVIFTGTQISADPYFDGFNWTSHNQDLFHWSKSTYWLHKVASGSYEELYDLCGGIESKVCGFGGSNAGFIANINISQCDDKLYCIWNQIHERANRFPWRCTIPQPAEGVLDDCSYTGNREAMANWEIMMSVSTLDNSSLWDRPRSISNTYTPGCGLAGDPDAFGLCGNEYKPSVEKYGLDESGLSLSWPSGTLVDPTPTWDPPYSGTWFLNMQYLDDRFPGPAYWGETNPPATLNSVKWIRLACVEPIYTSEIAVRPAWFEWPLWVELGQVSDLTVTVTNEGNVTLNVTEIGYDDGGGGWLSVSENPSPSTPFAVPAGVTNTNTFDIVVNAGGLASTQWLDGEVWLKSDAANNDSLTIPIHILATEAVEPAYWDTVMTHANMFDIYFEPEGECVALAVSNFGEIGGLGGSIGNSYPYYSADGRVNLDYVESDLECGSRSADAIYLNSGSPFVISADDASGANAQLTCSYGHNNQAPVYGWDPTIDKGSMTGGVTAGGLYDSVYTGRFVNRDTSIAMERVFYAPRSNDPQNDLINFVICYTKFYSGDGQAHNHVTVGNVVDWNVPSERVNYNTSGVSTKGFVYVQGTDTAGLSCQPNTHRLATEAFLCGYTDDAWQTDSCVCNTAVHGLRAMPQSLLLDTTHYRNGTPLVPAQPNPLVWWEETATSGLSADPIARDQAVWLTYKQDYSLGATDTLHFWTVLTTVRDGTLVELEGQVSFARCIWHYQNIRSCTGSYCPSCCQGRVGNCNLLGGDEPTISDIAVMIDARFISGGCWVLGHPLQECLQECDLNQSGGCYPTCDDITISDISILIDYLFISGPENATLNQCLDCWKSGKSDEAGERAVSSGRR